MKKLYLLVLLVLVAHTSWAARYLFVLHSLGETNGLIPVMNCLDSKDYKILAYGKALEKLKDRPEVLFDGSLDKLETPEIVVVGMASRAQADALNFFEGKPVKRIAFYDNFDSPQKHYPGYLSDFYEAFRGADVLMVSGKAHVEGARGLDKFASPTIKIVALGQPSLESWDKIYAETNTKELRSKLGIEPHKKVILYAGGFDPKDKDQYEEDLARFIRAAAFFDGVEVLVTYHPKTDGALEKSIRPFNSEVHQGGRKKVK